MKTINFAPIELNDVEITSIVYDKEQHHYFKKEYDNSHIRTIEQRSYLFEYNPIVELSKYFDNEKYYGVFSWKFNHKTGHNKNTLFNEMAKRNYKQFEVINICQPLPKPYLEFTENYHKGFMDLFNPICSDLGLEVKEPKHTIYSNFFIAKGKVYKEYVELIKKAIELLDNKFTDLAWRDANYKSGLNPEQLKEKTGLDYYTFHTFILERLMSIWIDNKKIKTLDIL